MKNVLHFLKRTHVIALLLVINVFTSCAVNPVTGKKQLSFLSYADEDRLGRQADGQVTNQYGLYNDNQKVNDYVKALGQRMAHISHRPFLEFHFRVVDSPIVNAFALPGGYIYVTRGLLAYMNSEAELAGVEGHEIGHVTARHAASQYTKSRVTQFGFGIGSIFLAPTSILFSNATQLGVGLMFLGFSRKDEEQADSLGVEYSSRIGYDATRVAGFFKTLQRMREQSGQDLPTFLSTHPNPINRETTTLRMAKRWQKELPPFHFMVKRDHYLDIIDGLVFGKERRKGFTENGYFYNPLLDFQFPVPEGWDLKSAARQVRMENKKGTAVILFSVSDQTSADKAAFEFLNNQDLKLKRASTTTINGFTAEVRETEITQQQETLQILSYFIEKDGKVYTFQSFSKTRYFQDYLSTFKYTMDNFDRLKNQAAKNIEPTRVKIITVDKESTLKELLTQYPSNELSLEKMAILNGMNLTDVLPVGSRIKTLTR